MVGVCIHDYARAPFVFWENHDGLVLSRVFKRVSHLFVILGSGGSACLRILLTALVTVSTCLASSCLTADSILAIISVVEMAFSLSVFSSTGLFWNRLGTHKIN